MENKLIVLTPELKVWDYFVFLLEGEEGCDFKKDNRGKITWRCKGGKSKFYTRKIIKKYFKNINVPKTLKYFEEHGGYCDCEILFNVDKGDEHGR